MEGFSFKDTDRFLPLRLGATARETLQEFIDIDVTAEDLVRILHRNQAFKDLFSRFVNQKTQPRRAKPAEGEAKEAKEGRELPTPTHRLIGLLGMIGSRNLILALRMHKAIEGRFPIDEAGEVDVKASDYVKRALETEEVFLRNGLEYSETAYAAAVYYDWVIRLLGKQEDFKKGLEAFAEQQWKRAIRSGLLAYFLGHEVRGATPKLAMAGGFMLPAGKLLLAGHDRAYIDFDTKLSEQAALTPLARLLHERQRFGVAQEEIGSHSLRYFDVFHGLVPAVRCFREPYNLKGVDAGNYTMASLLYLADAMAQSWKIPSNEQDPVIQEWAHPSLKHLQLSATKLIKVMRSAMAVR